MLSQLIINKPDEPLQFLIDFLRKDVNCKLNFHIRETNNFLFKRQQFLYWDLLHREKKSFPNYYQKKLELSY